MHKKHIFLRVFSKITIFACVFCAFLISPVFASLPAGYTELEYIESTGTQYIDTGLMLAATNTPFLIDLDMSFSDVKGRYLTGFSNASPMYSGRYSNGSFEINNTYTTMKSGVNERLNFQYGIISEQGNKLGIKITKNGQIEYKMTGAVSIYISQATWLIFANNGGTSVDRFVLKGKIYYARAYKDNFLVFNGVPAKRNSDNEIGMYDTVSGTFFTNAGTGDFIAGPVAEIKIATTKIVDEEFAAAEAKLATTVQTIESVVSRTITQTGQIQILQDTKQTRPDESCPANMKCLLVQDEDGTPHWYPIIEP